MELVYERAFGGVDVSPAEKAKHGSERRNPVGLGFCAAKSQHIDRLPLANLEDPRELISRPEDHPAPAGFGFVGRGWLPRAARGGTYDDSWQKERAPLLPLDFDPLFFNGAPEDQVVRPHLVGGEPVLVRNASPDGELAFPVPKVALEVTACVKGLESRHAPVLDTLIIDPDLSRVIVCWRATLVLRRDLLSVEWIRVLPAKATP